MQALLCMTPVQIISISLALLKTWNLVDCAAYYVHAARTSLKSHQKYHLEVFKMSGRAYDVMVYLLWTVAGLITTYENAVMYSVNPKHRHHRIWKKKFISRFFTPPPSNFSF